MTSASKYPPMPTPATDMLGTVEAMKRLFLLPYPAIWSSLGIGQFQVTVDATVSGSTGQLVIKAPETNVVIMVHPTGAVEVGGHAKGVPLRATFKWRPESLGMHRGTQGDISNYIEDMIPSTVIYRVYGKTPGGRPMEFLNVADLIRQFHQEGTTSLTGNLRKELKGQPILKDLSGPMFDGREGDVAVVRYETHELADWLSRAASKVASRWVGRTAYERPTGLKVNFYGDRLSLKENPRDIHGQEYDTYLLTGGAKALTAGIMFARLHEAEIQRMSLHEAQKFVDDAIKAQTKSSGKWHFYSMPD